MMSIYAVNGKTPIAAWIPSRDDVGNGTTTLTDLVGSNNGTLTNMDPATDWVADTDAGGVRALDFDGVNDRVTFGSVGAFAGETPRTLSVWVKTSQTADATFFIVGDLSATGGKFEVRLDQNGANWVARVEVNAGFRTGLTHISNSAWRHIVVVMPTLDVVDAKIYVDGTEDAYSSTTARAVNVIDTNAGLAALIASSRQFAGRLDDIRIFDQALNATDVADLYASGSGRGITFGGTIQTRRRRQLGGYGL